MSVFAGTGKLFWLAARCDWAKLTIWIVCSGALIFASVWSVSALYNTPQEINSYTVISTTNVMARAFNGPILGATKQSVILTETFSFFTLLVAFASTLLVVRHTRLAEETGRAELIASGSVGVFASTAAALLLALCLNIALGVTLTVSYAACGLEWSGCALSGVAVALMGMTFAAVAAIASQITQTSRAANAIAGGSIALFFVVRAVGDVMGTLQPGGTEIKSSWLTMLSPMGLARETQPLIRDKLWPIFVLLALCAVLTAVAFVILKYRDLGSGLLPVRRGPAAASRSLSNVLGLAWRQQRGLLLGWAISVILLSVTLGAMAQETEKLSSSSPEMTKIIAVLGGSQNLVKAYLAFCMTIMGVMITAYAIQSMQKIRSEESDGRLEIILAGNVHRASWLLSHVVWAAAGSAILLALSGVAAGLTYGIIVDNVWKQVGQLTVAGISQLPAVLIFIAIMVVVFAIKPQLAIMLSWLSFTACYVIMQFADILNLQQWVVDLSPFTHIPAYPAEDFSWPPLIIMALIAIVAVALGALLFRRRNLTTV